MGREPFDVDQFLAWIPILIIAFFGALAKFANDFKNDIITQPSVSKLIAHIVTSCFAGWIGGVICKHVGLNTELVLVGAGLSGYMGATALDAIWEFVKKKVGLNDRE